MKVKASEDKKYDFFVTIILSRLSAKNCGFMILSPKVRHGH